MDFNSLLDFALLTEFKGFFCIDLSDLCFKSITTKDIETLQKLFIKIENLFS